MDDAELNAIRAARLAELQKNAGGGGGSSQGSGADSRAASKQDDVKLSMLARLLEASARERLSRVRIVRPDRADAVEQYILKLYQMGSITQKLTEQDVVQILDGISRDQNASNSTKIVYDRKNVDDDDDDFFD